MTDRVRPFYSPGGINAETYDTRTSGFPGEIDFWVARARESGGPVLELACGTGRVSWPIARAGIDIVGLDLGPAMLEQAERKRASEPTEVAWRTRFVRGDMGNFDLGQTFGLVIIPFRAFQSLLEAEQQRAALGAIWRHLRPGGRLIIDIFDPRLDLLFEERFKPTREIPSFRNPRTGHTVSIDQLERRNDHVRQRLVERWRFFETADDGRIVRDEEEELELRWTYRYEMRYLFELTGFAIESEWSDFQYSPPAYGREQIWVATRRS
ncbi:MAG TPA: class I SAM-dependent methyltransferase [Gemmatimonadaceae bacterium]|nr:class I SAM-dependent methyltransferase [Gemmatimonadaceae bacterium]